jgi:hypothetical protein
MLAAAALDDEPDATLRQMLTIRVDDELNPDP